jgi:hypothetical protein
VHRKAFLQCESKKSRFLITPMKRRRLFCPGTRRGGSDGTYLYLCLYLATSLHLS